MSQVKYYMGFTMLLWKRVDVCRKAAVKEAGFGLLADMWCFMKQTVKILLVYAVFLVF